MMEVWGCCKKPPHLAAHALSRNAGGASPSAGGAVDEAWRDHLPAARAVLRTLREPDGAMARAGDPRAWAAMVAVAIEQADAGSD